MGAKHGNTMNIQYNSSFNINKLQMIEHCAPFVIWKDEYGNFYQQYKIFVHTSQALEQQLKIYEQRRRQLDYLVNVCSYRIVNRQFDDSGYLELEVFTQRIPLTLSQYSRITFEKALDILNQSIKGFELIYDQIGSAYEINDTLIGFDNQGKIKVWINSNWAINQKLTSSKSNAKSIDQNIMILKLLQSVQKHIQLCPLMINWLENRQLVKLWNFQTLRQFFSKFKATKQKQKTIKFTRGEVSKNKIKMTKFNNEMRSLSPPLKFNAFISLGNNCQSLASLVSDIQVRNSKFSKSFKNDSYKIRTQSPILPINTIKQKSKSFHVQNSQNVGVNGSNKYEKRKNVQFLGLSFKPKEKKSKRKNSNATNQFKEAKSMMTIDNQTIGLLSQYTIGISKVSENSISSPLQKIRGQLRNYIGSKQQKLNNRLSCPEIASQTQLNKSTQIKQKSIQFKKANMKKNKKLNKTNHQTSLNPFLNLAGNHQSSPASKQQSFEQIRKRNSSFNVFEYHNLDQSRRLQYLVTQKTITKKQKASLFSHNRLDILQSTIVNTGMKSAGHSIILQTNKPDSSMITLASRAKQLKSSQIIKQDLQLLEYKTQSQQSKSITKSLRSKSIMTRSIALSTPKKKTSKKQQKKQLNKLDMLLIRRNLEKNKTKEQIFNQSMDLQEQLALITSFSNKIQQSA